MACELGENISALFGGGADKLLVLKEKWSELVGGFTFDFIVRELKREGKAREPLKIFQFREDLFSLEDLKEEMICPGIVSNVTRFGVFVNVGVRQDGLVHFSEMPNPLAKIFRKNLLPGIGYQLR